MNREAACTYVPNTRISDATIHANWETAVSAWGGGRNRHLTLGAITQAATQEKILLHNGWKINGV